MKQELIILTFFLTTNCFGQSSTHVDTSINMHETISRLEQINDLKTFSVIGKYYISNGFSGYELILDSNHTFKKIGFGCMGRSTVDFGKWNLQNGNTLILKSNDTIIFDLIKFDNYYFIISKPQREKFINDYLVTKEKFKHAKPFTLDGKTYSVEYMIGFALMEKYFAKQIDNLTGS